MNRHCNRQLNLIQSCARLISQMRVVLRLKIRQQAEAIKSDLQLRNLGMGKYLLWNYCKVIEFDVFGRLNQAF